MVGYDHPQSQQTRERSYDGRPDGVYVQDIRPHDCRIQNAQQRVYYRFQA
jgi:hypothetical protein